MDTSQWHIIKDVEYEMNMSMLLFIKFHVNQFFLLFWLNSEHKLIMIGQGI